MVQANTSLSSVSSTIADIFKIIVIVIRVVFSLFCVTCQSLVRIIAPVPLKSLENETILITGAASGIGKATCLEILKVTNGKVRLVCWDINSDMLSVLSNELKEKGGSDIFTYVVDVSNKDQVTAASNTVKQDVGDVTMIINNAGIIPVTKFLDQTAENIELTMSINVLSHFWIIREFLPVMIRKNSGHIVAIASSGSFIASRNLLVYHASKYAIHGYMEALEDELLDYLPECNIELSTVYPLWANTSFAANKTHSNFTALSKMRQPSDIAKEIVSGVRRNDPHIYIPNFISHIFFLRILPYKVQQLFKKLVPTYATPPEPLTEL